MINSVRFLKLCCSVAALVATLVIAQTVHAQDAVAASSVIKGRVANAATGQFLSSAVVTIDGTKIETKTETDGSYRLSGLTPGVYSLTVTYAGLDNETHSVEVTSGEQKVLDFDLTSNVYVLGSFTVAAEREGSAKALQEQRQSDSQKNIVAADSFGDLVDGNVGELMKNLPGITIDYQGEDAGAMRFRGMDASMASVTLNGNAVATNPGGDSRAFQLRDFAVQNIEVIELSFVPTAAMSGNSMGGSINFITKSAFDTKGRRLKLDGNMSLNSTELQFQKTPGGGRTPDRKLMPGFGFLYSEALGKSRNFGLTLIANMSRQYRFNDSYELPGGYSYNSTALTANRGVVSPEMEGTIGSVQWTERGQADSKQMVSMKLEYKLSDSSQFYLEASMINNQGLGGYSHSVRVNEGSSPQHTQASNFENMILTAGANVSATTSVFNNNLKGYTFNPGAKHRFGNLEVAYDGFYAKQKYSPDVNKNFSTTYTADSLGISVLDISGNATGKIVQTMGGNYKQLSNYGITSTSGLTMNQDWTYGTDEQAGAKIDIKKPFVIFGVPIKFQTGARYNQAERDLKRHYRNYMLTGDSTSNSFGNAAKPGLAQFGDRYFGGQWDFSVPVATWVNPYTVHDYYDEHPNYFYDSVTTSTGQYYRENGGKRKTKEAVSAGYLMATTTIMSDLTLLTGVRYEQTKLMARGMEYEDPNYPSTDGIFAVGKKYDIYTPSSPYYGYTEAQKRALLWSPIKAWKQYDNVFPNAQLKYEPFKNLIFRAAYSTNISRPDLNNVLPGATIYKSYYLIKMNNPDLKPQKGENFDFKTEYFLPKYNGVLGLSIYRQIMTNWINSSITYIDLDYNNDGELTPWEIQTPMNVGKGTNQGFELQYQQRLGFVAEWLKNVEIKAVFSAADPKAQYQRPIGAVPDPRLALTNPAQYALDQDAYQNGPTETVFVPLANVIKRAGSVSFSYNGRLFSATIGGYWRDKFMRSFNSANLEQKMQASDFRIDTKLSYKISSRWNVNFDWRNVTNVPDERSIFDRTGGYYRSGMIINLGLHADL